MKKRILIEEKNTASVKTEMDQPAKPAPKMIH